MTIGFGRRQFIALLSGAVLTSPNAVQAQQGVAVVGYLDSTSPGSRESIVGALRQGLREAGFVEGTNLTIEDRWAEDHNDRLPSLAADLVNKRVAVIVTSAIRATLAAKGATSEIPIVFATANDPVRFGLVASFNRPGGNITGITWLSAALGEKMLGVLHDLVPGTNAFGVLVNPNNANADVNVKNVGDAAQAVKASLVVSHAATEDDFDTAISMLVKNGTQAIVVLNDPLFTDQRIKLVNSIARYAIPAIYSSREFVDAGGLMSYGASIADAHRQAGLYAARILKGEKPADLPVLQPTNFNLIINLKTAKALGITVPQSLLATADEVIE
jgi:putative tryptophan/tyrosine transport system substrate-binding protein